MASNCDVVTIDLPKSEDSGSDEDIENLVLDRSRNNSSSSQHGIPDAEMLEQIVTCPIHLGILKDPRKLSCQHAFCRICLDNLLQYSGTLICPTCRKEETMNCRRADELPRALCESQLVEVIMSERLKREENLENEIRNSGSPTIYKRFRMVSQNNDNQSGVFTFRDLHANSSLANSREQLHQQRINTDPVQSTVSVVRPRPLPTSASQSLFSTNLITSNMSNASSTYDMMDIETIRENMLTYSDYKVVKRDRVKKICKSLNYKKTTVEAPEFHTFDVSIKDHQLVLVCSKTSKFLVYSEEECRSFYIYIDNNVVHPIYIRVHNGDLYLTGYYFVNDVKNYVFIQSNMYGKIVRKTENYVIDTETVLPADAVSSNSNNNSNNNNHKINENMLLGFDVNFIGEQFFVCFPMKKFIRVYNTSLAEQSHYFQFDSNYPEYVAFYRQHNQLWVSCPFNKRILIVELSNGAFRQFHTEQINKAIPTIICCTDDERIVFLDSSTNRFIWIKRRHDYILTQKLNMRSLNLSSSSGSSSSSASTNNEVKIRNFQTLPMSMLIVNTDHDITLFQPAKMSSKSPRNHSPCTLL